MRNAVKRESAIPLISGGKPGLVSAKKLLAEGG
jgi:hypothetical protein